MVIKTLGMKTLINLGIFAFGLQFVSLLQTSNMSSLYKFLGASTATLPFLGLAGPIAGLLIQPLIGQMSDDTYTPYGKRRPYIFFWGLLIFISSCLLTLSQYLWLAVILGWILSFSINGCSEALRALTGDVVPNAQKAKAFSVQTIFAGLGAGLAGFLPYIYEKSGNMGLHRWLFNHIPLPIKISFIQGAIILLASLCWVLYAVREKKLSRQQLLIKIKQKKHKNFINLVQQFFGEIFVNIKRMPRTMRQFMIIQIFTWMGIFTFWLFFNLALAQHVYGLPLNAMVNNEKYSSLFARGTIKAGLYVGLYQYISIAFACILPKLTEKYSAKIIHGFALILGAIGIIISSLVAQKWVLALCMIGVGVMWGSIMTLPYVIVTSEVPPTKMGIYLGIFNISITLPQIAAAFLIQPIHEFIFKENATYSVLLSGLLILIGGLITIYKYLPVDLDFTKMRKALIVNIFQLLPQKEK